MRFTIQLWYAELVMRHPNWKTSHGLVGAPQRCEISRLLILNLYMCFRTFVKYMACWRTFHGSPLSHIRSIVIVLWKQRLSRMHTIVVFWFQEYTAYLCVSQYCTGYNGVAEVCEYDLCGMTVPSCIYVCHQSEICEELIHFCVSLCYTLAVRPLFVWSRSSPLSLKDMWWNITIVVFWIFELKPWIRSFRHLFSISIWPIPCTSVIFWLRGL